jgi:hypothetical protein
VLQALETERDGIQVYETAVSCADDDELREEWEKYLESSSENPGSRRIPGGCQAPTAVGSGAPRREAVAHCSA